MPTLKSVDPLVTPAVRVSPAHAEIVSIASVVPGGVPLGEPEGVVRLTWMDFNRIERTVEVTKWWRLDNWLIPVGSDFDVLVQARQAHDLRLPLMQTEARCTLTCDPNDLVTVLVGDSERQGWSFGLVLTGVRLADEGATL